MVTDWSGERSFSGFKRIKNELKGRNIPEEVVHTKHAVHKKWQIWQTNSNEFLDTYVIKKAEQKLFSYSLCYVQPYLIRLL